MDTVFAQAVTKISELPQGTQRIIGEALLEGAGQPELPVIEFTPEEHTLIDEALADVAAGRLADPKEVDALFAKQR